MHNVIVESIIVIIIVSGAISRGSEWLGEDVKRTVLVYARVKKFVRRCIRRR